MESNAFATDEFMKWYEVAGTKPYLCLNMGTGTLDEGMLAPLPPRKREGAKGKALAWVEYCNGTKDTTGRTCGGRTAKRSRITSSTGP